MNKAILNNFPVFTGKHLRWSLFCLFIKMKLQHRYFPVNIAKFLRTSVLKSIVKIEGVKERKQYTTRLSKAYLGAIKHLRWSFLSIIVNDFRHYMKDSKTFKKRFQKHP